MLLEQCFTGMLIVTTMLGQFVVKGPPLTGVSENTRPADDGLGQLECEPL